MKTQDAVLYAYLVESGLMEKDQFDILTENDKMETVRDMAATILRSIKDKIETSDSIIIDRSKGDIKQLKDYPAISGTLNNIEELINRAGIKVDPGIIEQLKVIGKSILYLNQYAPQFKDAYRNNKTLLILKYQSLILSIISATSYLLSILVDFSGENVSINPNPKYEEITPIKTLKDFNKSIESGEFRLMLRDVQLMRESYNENENLTENETIQELLFKGVKNLYSSIDNSGKLLPVIYKALGIVALIFSLREVFYMLSNMRIKITDMISNLRDFANIDRISTGLLGKLGKFTNQLKVESEFGTEMAEREIRGEDRNIASNISPLSFKQATQSSETTTDSIKNDIDNILLNF